MNKASLELEVQKAALQLSAAAPPAWDHFMSMMKLLSTQADNDCISASPENLVPAQARARYMRDHVQMLENHRQAVGQALDRKR